MNNRFSIRRGSSVARFWVLATIFLCASWCCADDASTHHRRMENRFLFVIDTSSAMKARTNGLQAAVMGLLDSDLKGELRKGDTIGLWTYSDRLSTDFPMQVWSERKKGDILNDVGEHLRILVYENRSHLERTWPAIQQVVAASERLTIFLINDGSDPVKGTPYDKDINKLQKQYAHDFRSVHQPFVTVLAARDGKIFDYYINHPDSIVVPHMADPVPPPETNEPPVVAEALAPAVVPPPKPRIQINLTGADFPHHTNPPPAAVAVVSEPAPAPAPTPTNTNAPAPAVVTNASAPAPAAAAAVEPAPAAPTVNTNVAPAEPAPAAPPADSTPPSPTGIVAPAKAITPESAPPDAAASEPISPAAAPASSFHKVAIIIMAFSLLTIAVALVVFLVWRWRDRSQPSLISQSIDRSR
jgi:hypothetical protein